MDSAVRFEQADNKVRVKYWLRMNEACEVELHTVLKAMDVCLYFSSYSFFFFLLDHTEIKIISSKLFLFYYLHLRIFF
jgi:hypothetical protein